LTTPPRKREFFYAVLLSDKELRGESAISEIENEPVWRARSLCAQTTVNLIVFERHI
jgi:hypothetical protein